MNENTPLVIPGELIEVRADAEGVLLLSLDEYVAD
jgi:hypothetical protein